MPCGKKGEVTLVDKVNFIRHYAVNGCSTTLKVYVESGIQADTNLFLGIVNTSPKDFVRFLLRPKGARTERHGIRGLGTDEAAAEDELIPDTAKLAADTIHEISGWHVPTWGALGDFLFEVARPAFVAGYYLLLANATVDFGFDWYSGILLSPDSKCSIGRLAYLGGDNPITPHGYKPFYTQIPLFPPAGAGAGINGIDIYEGTWAVEITAQITNDAAHPGAATAFAKLMIGAIDRSQCGGVFSVSIGPFETFNTVKVVRKIIAPETISLDYAFHIDTDPVTTYNLDFLIEAFRI